MWAGIPSSTRGIRGVTHPLSPVCFAMSLAALIRSKVLGGGASSGLFYHGTGRCRNSRIL